MGIPTVRGYAIIIRHRFEQGWLSVSLVSNPVSVRPHLSTEIQGFHRLPSAHSARMQFRSQTRTAAMGDARGGEAVQSVAMATYRHWTPFTPHFIYVPSLCTVIRRPDNIVPYRAKNTGLLLRCRELSSLRVEFDHRFTRLSDRFARPTNSFVAHARTRCYALFAR